MCPWAPCRSRRRPGKTKPEQKENERSCLHLVDPFIQSDLYPFTHTFTHRVDTVCHLDTKLGGAGDRTSNLSVRNHNFFQREQNDAGNNMAVLSQWINDTFRQMEHSHHSDDFWCSIFPIFCFLVSKDDSLQMSLVYTPDHVPHNVLDMRKRNVEHRYRWSNSVEYCLMSSLTTRQINVSFFNKLFCFASKFVKQKPQLCASI